MTVSSNEPTTGTEILLGFLRDAEIKNGNASFCVGKINYILSNPGVFNKKTLLIELEEIKRILKLETEAFKE